MWGTPMVGRIAARWRQAVSDLAESRKLPQGCDATRGSHLQRSDERLQQTIRARVLLILKRDARSRVGFAARAGGTQPCLVEIGYFFDGAMERAGGVLAHHPDGMLAGRGTGRNLKHSRKGRAKHRRSQAAAGEDHSRGLSPLWWVFRKDLSASTRHSRVFLSQIGLAKHSCGTNCLLFVLGEYTRFAHEWL